MKENIFVYYSGKKQLQFLRKIMSRANIYNRCIFGSTICKSNNEISIIIISTSDFSQLGKLKLFIREICNLPIINIVEEAPFDLLNLLEDNKFKTIKMDDFRELRDSIIEFKESFEKKIYLTNREKQILSLLVEGLSINNRAYKLGISPKTVVTHKRNLFLKANVHSNLQLMLWSFDQYK